MAIVLDNLLSCTETVKENAHNEAVLSQFQCLKNSLADSINRFYFLDDYTKKDDSSRFVLHGTIINQKNIGLIALTDSSLFLFQTLNNSLKQTDSIKFDTYAYSFEVIDLNGDNKDDFIVNSSPDIHGQKRHFVFLYKEDGLLHYRPDLQLPNIRYNNANKTIETYYESCAYCIHSKAVYTWDTDTLRLLKSAELDLTNAKEITTRIFEVKNETERKILEVKSENNIYDTALFEIYISD